LLCCLYIARAFYIRVLAGAALDIAFVGKVRFVYIKEDKSLCRRLSRTGRGGGESTEQRAPDEWMGGGVCEGTDAATAAAVEKAGRLLLLFNPSGKLNGGGQADNNESARATNIAIEIVFVHQTK